MDSKHASGKKDARGSLDASLSGETGTTDLASSRGVFVYNLVIGETQLIMSVMRRNNKWRTQPLDFQYPAQSAVSAGGPSELTSPRSAQPSHPVSLIRHFEIVRRNLQHRNACVSMDRLQVVQPFVDVICSEETSGVVTGIALASLQKFLEAGLLDSGPGAEAALEAVVHAVNNCRFEATDTTRDEVVLLKILQLQVACLNSRAARGFHHEAVWNMIQTCFRIHRQMRPPDYSELLCDAAENTLTDVIRILFSGLHQHIKLASTSSFSDTNPSGQVMSPRMAVTAGFMDEPPPYPVPILVRVFRFLCSLTTTPGDQEEHGLSYSHRVTVPLDGASWSHVALVTQLLLTAVETAGTALAGIPELLALVKNSVWRFITRNCTSQNTLILSLTLRLVFNLATHMRRHLPMQLEVVLRAVYLQCLHRQGGRHPPGTIAPKVPPSPSGLASMHYDVQEVVLESLLDFSGLPWFFAELLLNFDCQLFSPTVFDSLFKGLCQSVFPVNGVLTGNHVLALRCIMRALRHISQRCVRQLPSSGDASEEIHESASETQVSSQPSLGHTAVEALMGGSKESSDHCSHHRDVSTYLRHMKRARQALSVVADAFNAKPMRGLQQLQVLDVLSEDMTSQKDVEMLARFLRFCPDLDKPAVGELLGRPDNKRAFPFFAKLREAYCATFDFGHLTLDEALRTFLEAFRLPGEAQQIDRLIGSFAVRYHEQAPELLENVDAIHTLAFSLIMLNTDAHSDQVKKKMTLEQFISNNRGINGDKDVPHDLQGHLYRSITSNEIKMSGDSDGGINDSLWTDMVHRDSLLPRAYLELSTVDPVLDREIFLQGCDPAIAAFSVVFDLYDGPGTESPYQRRLRDNHARELTGGATTPDEQLSVSDSAVVRREGDPGVMDILEEGFLLVAGIGAHMRLHDVVDRLASKLFEHSTLLEDCSFQYRPPHRQLLRFAAHGKAHQAAQVAFNLVRRFGDGLRSSWREVFMTLMQLYALDVLPQKLLILDDLAVDIHESRGQDGSLVHIDAKAEQAAASASTSPSPSAAPASGPDQASDTVNIPRCSRRELLRFTPCEVRVERGESGSLVWNLASYLLPMSGSTSSGATVRVVPRPSKPRRIQVALELVREWIDDCQLESLLAETRFLPFESLEKLLLSLADLISFEVLLRPPEVDFERHAAGPASAVLGQNTATHSASDSVTSSPQQSPRHGSTAGEADDSKHSSVVNTPPVSRGERTPSTPNTDPQALPYQRFFSVLSNSYSVRPPLELRRTLLCLQLYTTLLAHNQHRAELWWPLFVRHLGSLLSPSTVPPPVVKPSPSLNVPPTPSGSGSGGPGLGSGLTLSPTRGAPSTPDARDAPAGAAPANRRQADNAPATQSRSLDAIAKTPATAASTDRNDGYETPLRRSATVPLLGVGMSAVSVAPSVTMLVEGAVVALITVSKQLLSLPNMRDRVMRGLELLVSVDLGPPDPATVEVGAVDPEGPPTSSTYTGRFAPLRSLSEQFSGGILQLLRAHANVLSSHHGWVTVLQLIRKFSQHRFAFANGFQSVLLLLCNPDCSCAALSRMRLCAEVLADYATSPFAKPHHVHQCVDLLVDLQQRLNTFLKAPSTNTDTPSSIVAISEENRAGGTRRRLQLGASESPESSPRSTQAPGVMEVPEAAPTDRRGLVPPLEWREYRRPLFLAIRAVCETSSGTVREYALTHLQRGLLSMPALYIGPEAKTSDKPSQHAAPADNLNTPKTVFKREVVTPTPTKVDKSMMAAVREAYPNTQTATALCWQGCLDDVLFPLLRALGELPGHSADIVQARVLALKLMCRIFLIHLPQFLLLKHAFHHTWLNVLNTLELYVHVGKDTELAESAQESLKNLLLVVSSAGVFTPAENITARELWDLTWAVVDPFWPELKGQLFASGPTQTGPVPVQPTPGCPAGVGPVSHTHKSGGVREPSPAVLAATQAITDTLAKAARMEEQAQAQPATHH